MNGNKPVKKKSKMRFPGLGGKVTEPPKAEPLKVSKREKLERRKTMSETRMDTLSCSPASFQYTKSQNTDKLLVPSGSKSRVTFDEPERPTTNHASGPAPPAYGDDAASTLALPINRLSESSRSDGSSGDHGVYATTTTTTHTVHTTTTFFRLPRRKKQAPLFDLSHLPQKSPQKSNPSLAPPASHPNSSTRTLEAESSAVQALNSPSVDDVTGFASPLPSPSRTAVPKSMLAGPGTQLFRNGSTTSTQSSPSRTRGGLRGRSSTLSSLRNLPTDDPLPTPTLPSTRTSSSIGRKSFGDIFGLTHRLRQNSEPHFNGSGPATPASSTSKNNSMQLTREPEKPIVLPERFDDDTPAKYLVRLEEAVSRGVVASVLSKGSDPFSQAVLRSYMRGFGFFGDPMDMAIRKLLMEVELPKETQHIDRCMQGFANRYHECNPGIFASPDQAYFIAFSLLILHTDVFNKNNKHKMQRPDYLKNTHGEGIFDEILECFYDNISYTPFIHVEDDLDINGERIIPHKTKKKSIFPRSNADPTKKSKDPVDPYTLIIDSKLDTLRPNLEIMYLEEHFSYLGTAPSLNLENLQKTFFRTGVLQIISARSRPDAFMNDKTDSNPQDAHPGIVDIKITKVGLLWRKDAKKKKTRSPWQEWGAILTGAQLYFFRNTTWIKSLMNQHETHIKQGHDGIPVIFKPPLENFKPDALMSTDNAVALLDSTYKKHKNAFVFVRHGTFEETFLAENEDQMNDWLAKLNYAAAFRTSGVRMRGVVGGHYEGQRTRGMRRLDSSHNDSTKSVQSPTGEVTIVSGKIDTKMANDILAARREIMLQKIAEAEEQLAETQKQLDNQLRNGRHLQILAPIQVKTRNEIIEAASRMATQLKWSRIEIGRLKCHRDILRLDLEEEKGLDSGPSQHDIGDTAITDRATVSRLNSKTSTVVPQRSPRSPPLARPTTRESNVSEGREHGMGDMFESASLARASSFHKAQASWELPPLNFDQRAGRKSSLSSVQPSSPTLTQAPSRVNSKPTSSADTPRRPSNTTLDAVEQAVLEEAGLIDGDFLPEGNRPTSGPEPDESKDQVSEKDKDKVERGKIRRSLHRTLKEAHVPKHNHSRKGKESTSSGAASEEPDDVLSRGTGSFVVHGKKASVITFGSELQSMSPDERLRLRKLPHKGEGQPSPATIDDDFHSVLAEPFEYHERHESTATSNTATAMSFREKHKNLTVPGSTPSITMTEGDDNEAISISEGRRTPLSPVNDGDEDDDRLGPNSPASRQAMFYTPEASNSPASAVFPREYDERNEGEDSERRQRLQSPSLQLVSAS